MKRAELVVLRCQTDGGLVGLRCEEMAPNDWEATWSFSIPEDNKEYHSGGGLSGNEIHGAISLRSGIDPCSRCQADGFVSCSRCERVTCWSGMGKTFSCSWCSASGEIRGEIDRLKTSDDA